MAQIPLSDAIEALREQLQTSMDAGGGKKLRFDILDLELELQTVVTRESKVGAETKGEIKFWLLSAGADTQASHSSGQSHVQTIRLKLRPAGGRTKDNRLSG